MKWFIFLLVYLFLFQLHANDKNSTLPFIQDKNNTNQDINTTYKDTNSSEQSYIDSFHKSASTYILGVSGFADETLVNMATYLLFSENKEKPEGHPLHTSSKDITSESKEAVDFFFLQRKYLDETDKSYIGLRPEIRFSSKKQKEYNFKFSVHLALSKSKKRFKLFINEINNENKKDIINGDTTQTSTSIGVNYFLPETYGIKSKYSLGVQGFYPFARARFSIEFHPGDWIIQPIQIFKYSSKDEFKEETQIFFDTKVTDLSLFRFFASRKTQSQIPAMAYDASISIFYSPYKGLGLSVTEFLNGTTNFIYTPQNTYPLVAKEFSGIYNYGTSFTLRQNIWKPWLFYEVRPRVSFHKQYNYDPEYSLTLFFDIFVGNF